MSLNDVHLKRPDKDACFCGEAIDGKRAVRHTVFSTEATCIRGLMRAVSYYAQLASEQTNAAEDQQRAGGKLGTINGFQVLAAGAIPDAPGMKAGGRIVLVDRGAEEIERYATAEHVEGEFSWYGGDYFASFDEAVASFNSRWVRRLRGKLRRDSVDRMERALDDARSKVGRGVAREVQVYEPKAKR